MSNYCKPYRKDQMREILPSEVISVLDRFIKEFLNKEFGKMKFDVVIGNPPYNNDMYLDFVTLGHQLAQDYTIMITPAKWQAKTDGKPKNSKNPTPDKNEEFRKNIVPYMSKIIFYPNTRDIFDISEGGGISYFVIDKHIHNEKDVKTICKKSSIMRSEFEPHDETNVTLYNHKILSIIGKVGTLGEGFKQSLYVKNTDHGEITIDGTLGFRRQTFIGEQDLGEALKQVGYVEVMQGEKVVGYKAIKELFTTAGLGKYKCITSIIISGGGGDFNKGAKILVCGVFLFALAHTGFGWVGETIDNISDVFEAKSKIEEVQSNRNNSSNSKPKSKNIKKEYNSVKGKIDIEADDVKDILEYLYDKLSDNNIDTKDTDIVFTDYKALKDAKSYNKNIVKKLKKYSNPVTFVLINDGRFIK